MTPINVDIFNFLKGLLTKNFIGLKDAPFPLYEGVMGEKSENSYKKYKYAFLSNIWSLKIAYQTRKWLSKRHYQTGIWLSKRHYQTGIGLSNIITKREFGSQIPLLDKKLALKLYKNWALPSCNDI